MTPQQGNAPDFSKAGKYGERLFWLQQGKKWALMADSKGKPCVLVDAKTCGDNWLLEPINPESKRLKRMIDCHEAMAGIQNPAQWVKAVEDLDSIFVRCHRCEGNGEVWADGRSHFQSDKVPTVACGFCAGEGKVFDKDTYDEILAKLTDARTGGKE